MRELIPGIPIGSNISILYVHHCKPRYNEATKKWSDRVVRIIYKDMDTGEMCKAELKDPEYEYFIVKEDGLIHGDRDLFTSIDDCDRYYAPYSKLDKEIADKVGMTQVYNNNMRSGNKSANKLIHLNRRVRNSDLKLENHMMVRFDRCYKNEIFIPTKAYFDIETDNNYLPEGMEFPDEPGICPINAISYIFDKTMTNNVYILIDENNPKSVEFFNEFKANPDAIFTELDSLVFNHVGETTYEKSIKGMTYNFKFFEDEISLIATFCKDVNEDKPNFLMVWNMSFDIPFIIERLKRLGVDPRVVMCHPDFKYKYADYYLDTNNIEPAQKNDSYNISSYTVPLDQMIIYASRRKSNTSIGSFALDNISNLQIEVGKLQWGHIANTFAEFIRKDFKTFIYYNIMDTLVQKCIEDDVKDIDFSLTMSNLNCTVMEKIYRQTVYLHNRAVKEFYKNGYIIGNNHNLNTPKESFPGAFVADNKLISDFSKVKINGRPVKLYDNADDYDAKSLYPNTIRQFNISLTTQVGRIKIDKPTRENENKFNNNYYRREGRFIEDYTVRNPINFCHRWLRLGSFEELYDDVLNYMSRFNMDYDLSRPMNLFEKNVNNDLFIENKYEMNLFNTYNLPRSNEIYDIVNDINIFDVYDTTVKEGIIKDDIKN